MCFKLNDINKIRKNVRKIIKSNKQMKKYIKNIEKKFGKDIHQMKNDINKIAKTNEQIGKSIENIEEYISKNVDKIKNDINQLKQANEQIKKSIDQVETKLDSISEEIKQSNEKINNSIEQIGVKLDTIDCRPETIKKYIDNIFTWKKCLCGVCVVLVLCIIGLIVFSICCISKYGSSNAQPTKETLTITENKTDEPCIKSTAELSTHIPWNNNPYFFLFLIACLGLIGAVIFFLCNSCREKTKQALLTYAYDEALEKLKDKSDKKTTEISGKCFQKNQKETIEYGVRAVTKIFETYCQNITSK